MILRYFLFAVIVIVLLARCEKPLTVKCERLDGVADITTNRPFTAYVCKVFWGIR